MISGLTGKSYEEKCEELGIETLEARRKKQDLYEAFKILKGPEPNYAEPWNLKIPMPRLDIRKYSYTGRTSEAWNKLPAELN